MNNTTHLETGLIFLHCVFEAPSVWLQIVYGDSFKSKKSLFTGFFCLVVLLLVLPVLSFDNTPPHDGSFTLTPEYFISQDLVVKTTSE